MSLSKSKSLYSNKCLHFIKLAVPLVHGYLVNLPLCQNFNLKNRVGDKLGEYMGSCVRQVKMLVGTRIVFLYL